MRVETHETIADIIAAKRRLAAEMGKALGDQHSFVELLEDDADRLEAAHKREMATAEKSSAVGNAAKLYEAVGYILKYADSAACRDHDEHTRHYIDQIRKWAQSALAAPPRNCDVGTAEEQTKRKFEFCQKQGSCGNCSLNRGQSITPCVLAWAQMPYEEGGAK